jgi:hypothetical protein
MPVLQGYAPADYAAHVRAYGDRLAPRAWVGVGSVCKRNAARRHRGGPAGDQAGAARPPLAWLRCEANRPHLAARARLLFSADSMAWSFAARYENRDGNDPAEAVRYQRRIATMPVQLHLLTDEFCP